jgi:beta-carotene hydroxylase
MSSSSGAGALAMYSKRKAVEHGKTVPTPGEEKHIAKVLSPGLAWPTLLLAVALPATLWSVVALGLARAVPLWICTPVLALLSYAHYTLVHESVHCNLAPGYPRLRWLNTLVGWIGALGLSYNWPILMRSHALHHAHTNSERDPDIWVRGTLGQLLVKWVKANVFMTLIPLFVVGYIAPEQYRRVSSRLRGSEVMQASVVALLVLLLLAIAVYFGRAADWFFLLFFPTRLASLGLSVFFSWLPHYPFDRTERYLNTRVSLWPAGTFLTLQQNLHLMHHLWPSVPFYNYARLYRALRPVLIAKGSRIEGFGVGQWARDLSRH